MPIDITDMLHLGLLLAGYNQRQRDRTYRQLLEWFAANFGCHPLVLCVLWERIEDIDGERKLLYFLITICWLKLYPTEAVMEARFNLDAKTIRGWIDYYSSVLEVYCDEVIVLPDSWGNDTFIGVVDGTHCRCYKPQHPEFPFDARYKSYKLGKDGLAYEVMIDMNGIPIWINGPYPAGTNDITIFRDSLIDHIPNDKLILGDKGYRGPNEITSTPNEYDTYDVREFKRKHRARMEQYNGRIKNFKILEHVYRIKGEGRMTKHRRDFKAVNSVVFTELKSGFPLFAP